MKKNSHEDKWPELDEAEVEAKRFLERVKRWRKENREIYIGGRLDEQRFSSSPKANAAVKRSSMDLSRALAALRKNGPGFYR